MAQRIYWEPTDDLSPTSYAVYIVAATESLLITVPNTVPGPFWLPTRRQFSFEDPQGTDATIYRIKALGPAGELYGDSGPFQPSAAIAARLASRKMVDHNYGAPDALRYVTASGQGVPDAIIRIFLASEWDAGRRVQGVAVVYTNNEGRWVSPVWLEPGLEFVVIAQKPNSYGADPVRITT